MKKILQTTVYNLIANAIVLGIFYLIFLPLWVALFLYVTLALSEFLALVLQEYVTITNIKKLYKRLCIFIRYKRVEEVYRSSCEGCIKDFDTCKFDAYDCLKTHTILAKRNYNIFKWLKKLFILFVVAILSVSCVTINVYKSEPQKTTPSDSTQIESYWF